MEEYLKRAEELKESVIGNYEHSTNIQDYELVEWLIEQAKKVHHYEKALEKIAEDRSVAFWELSSKVAKEALDS